MQEMWRAERRSLFGGKRDNPTERRIGKLSLITLEIHSFLFGKTHGRTSAALPSGPPDRLAHSAPRHRRGSPPRSELGAVTASEYARAEFEAFDVRSELAHSELAFSEINADIENEMNGEIERSLVTVAGEGLGGGAAELSDAQRLAQAQLGDALASAQLSRQGPASLLSSRPASKLGSRPTSATRRPTDAPSGTTSVASSRPPTRPASARGARTAHMGAASAAAAQNPYAALVPNARLIASEAADMNQLLPELRPADGSAGSFTVS